MTENEAKKTICPELRAAAMISVAMLLKGGFSDKEIEGLLLKKGNCVASRCQMWSPCNHWVDNKGGAWTQQNREKTLTKATGGDCGLKNYE